MVWCAGGPVQDLADLQHAGAGLQLQLQQHTEAAAGSHHLPLCGAPLRCWGRHLRRDWRHRLLQGEEQHEHRLAGGKVGWGGGGGVVVGEGKGDVSDPHCTACTDLHCTPCTGPHCTPSTGPHCTPAQDPTVTLHGPPLNPCTDPHCTPCTDAYINLSTDPHTPCIYPHCTPAQVSPAQTPTLYRTPPQTPSVPHAQTPTLPPLYPLHQPLPPTLNMGTHPHSHQHAALLAN